MPDSWIHLLSLPVPSCVTSGNLPPCSVAPLRVRCQGSESCGSREPHPCLHPADISGVSLTHSQHHDNPRILQTWPAAQGKRCRPGTTLLEGHGRPYSADSRTQLPAFTWPVVGTGISRKFPPSTDTAGPVHLLRPAPSPKTMLLWSDTLIPALPEDRAVANT